MPEQKLDLLQFASGQARATAAEVMGSEICDSGPPGSPLHNVPNGFRCDVLPPDRASSASSAEDKIGRDSGSPGPAIDCAFHPVRHWNRSNVLPLPDQVGDNPVFLTDLKVVDLQPHQLGAPEAASDQNCQNSSIPLSSKRIQAWCAAAANGIDLLSASSQSAFPVVWHPSLVVSPPRVQGSRGRNPTPHRQAAERRPAER
jgi:hypothetical protein